jgi:replication factor C subunit 2/4
LAQVLDDGSIGDECKAKMAEVAGEADKCLVDGADEFLQLLHVAAQSQRALNM